MTESDVADLSVVIVNWNSKEFLRKCLTSLNRASAGVRHEIIVVDNASFDGCAEMLRCEFPTVRFIQSEANLGFGKANNLGFAHSCGRNVLFLNPDTEIRGAALPTLMAFADAHPDAGIVGPKLLNSDLTVQMECVKAFPSLVNEILDSHYLKSRLPRLSIWGMRPLFDDVSPPAPVDVVSGAGLMIKRDVFESVGGFSQQYFMYSEDVDLCFKVKEAGWRVYFVGDAEVVHHGGTSSALTPVSQFAAVLTRESRFRFLRTARGGGYAFLFRLVTAANALCRLMVLSLAFWLLGTDYSAAAGKATEKWASILRWSLGLERWVRTLG